MVRRRRDGRKNEDGYQFLPRHLGDHSHMPMFTGWRKATSTFLCHGQNRAVAARTFAARKALAKLKWMVVGDLYEPNGEL